VQAVDWFAAIVRTAATQRAVKIARPGPFPGRFQPSSRNASGRQGGRAMKPVVVALCNDATAADVTLPRRTSGSEVLGAWDAR